MSNTNETQGRATRHLTGLPPKQGLYDPAFEHDSCGVGFLVNIKGKKFDFYHKFFSKRNQSSSE